MLRRDSEAQFAQRLHRSRIDPNMRIFLDELDDLSLTLTRVSFFLHTTVLWTTEAFPAQSVVLGSPRLIFSAPGDDVVLRCHLEPPVDIQALTVEWSKPDLQPDPSDPLRRVRYVHVHRNGGEVTDMKLRSYAGRTELLTEQLRHGNVSLKILNVTLADAARYRCFIPKLKSAVREATVQLVVDPNYIGEPTEPQLSPRDSQTPDPDENLDPTAGRPGRSHVIPAVIFSVALILGFGIACFLKHNNHRQTTSTAVPTPG